MNLIELDRVEDRAALTAAGGGFPKGNDLNGWSLGIRPEHIQLGERGLPAKVSAIDFLGAETILRVRHGEQTLFARLNGRADVETDALVMVRWPADAVHFFDSDGIRQVMGE